jgi:adenylate cyclase class 2
MKETEIKLKIADVSAVRQQLAHLGFVGETPREFEDNWIFDFPGHDLGHAQSLLRLRKTGDRALVTFKGPIEPQARYKIRDEIEVSVSDEAAVREIFTRLGLSVIFRYQKWRSGFHSHELGGGHVLLDETPVGSFLELEGAPEFIDEVARRLGFSPHDYILKSYAMLFLENESRQHAPRKEMLFESSDAAVAEREEA